MNDLNNTNGQEDKDTSREEWNPSPKQMESYLKREVEMARCNLKMCLSARQQQSLKDLKDCMLHTSDTLENALTLEVQAGRVKEDKGRFSTVLR